jgi:hypothetical protein
MSYAKLIDSALPSENYAWIQQFSFFRYCPVKHEPKSLLAQLCLENCDACRSEAMNNMCATNFWKSSLLLVAAVLLVLSGTEAQVPSPDEGADGVYEGSGEGITVTHATPSPDEGADGVYEGTGEGVTVTHATPSPDEGADGIFEGNGEGAAAGKHHT